MSLSSIGSYLSSWGNSIANASPKTKAIVGGVAVAALALTYLATRPSAPKPLTEREVVALHRESPLYQQSIQKAYEQANVDPAVRDMVDERVKQLAQRTFSGATSVSESHASDLASRISVVDPDSEEFQVVLQAAKDFEALLADAKKAEANMFSVSPAPPPNLEPAEGVQGAPYTLLKHSARPPTHLVPIAKAFGINGIRDLVPLTPQRLVLHEMCKNVVLLRQMPASEGGFDKQVATLIPALSEKFLSVNPTLERDAAELRATVEEQALTLLDGGQVAKPVHHDLQKVVEDLQAQAKKDTNLNPAELKQAIARRTADVMVESFVRTAVRRFDLRHEPLLAKNPPLPTQTEDTRRMFMINGGVASGKGTAEDQMVKRAAEQGVNWDEVLTLNTDSFKGMLLDPKDLSREHGEFYSGLTHDEASLIRNDILSTYRQRLDADTAPHLFVDQVWPAVDIIEMGASSKNGIDITIVQIPVQNSFKMAYARGESTGRFEHRPVILGSHSRVPVQLQESLQNAIKDKGKKNIRLDVLANVAKGVVEPVAHVDFEHGGGVIQDMDHMLKFYQKTSLNKEARTFGELYSSQDRDHERFEFMVVGLASFCPKGLLVARDNIPLYAMTQHGRKSVQATGVVPLEINVSHVGTTIKVVA